MFRGSYPVGICTWDKCLGVHVQGGRGNVIEPFDRCYCLKLIYNGYKDLIPQKLGDTVVDYSSYDVTNRSTVAF